MAYNKQSYKRYFIIDACINNKYKPFPSMKELLEACKNACDKLFDGSTIQKDIKAMKTDNILGFNAPIKYSRSKEGYYYSEEGYTIKNIQLNQSEIDSLHTVTDLMRIYGGNRVSHNFNHAIEKIFSSIKEKYETADKTSRQIVQTENSPEQKGFELFDFFVHVTKEKTPINFVYYSYEKREFNSIVFHPYLIKEFQNKWYAIGYSESDKGFKIFGMDTIHEPYIIKKEFKTISSFDPNFYINDIYGVFKYKNEPKQQIEFEVNKTIANNFVSQPIHASQKIESYFPSGNLLFSLKLIPSSELIRLFLQYSPNLKVTKPIWLRDEILNIHKKSLAI